jgi:hypothetical protein
MKSTAGPRIALIHATPLSLEPVNAAFVRLWPQAIRMNVLDDSLSADRARDGALTDEMTQRFVTLAQYARGTSCEGILFTCSAFGPAIEAAGRAVGIPTLKPNEAMFDQALAMGRPGAALKIALIATFAASIDSMAEELRAMAKVRGVEIDLRTHFVPEAMDDLGAGRAQAHHRKIAQAARAFAACDAVMLAQFSMAAAQPEVQRELPCPVLTSPDCAVRALANAMKHA